jgi:hypothetical protein
LPTEYGEEECWVMLSGCDSLRLCPQVELRSYVSEPELATLSGDMVQPSLGLVDPESRYQTLPGRGKARPSKECFRKPTTPLYCSQLQPIPCTSACSSGLDMRCEREDLSCLSPSDLLPDALPLLLHLSPGAILTAITIKPDSV